MRYILFIAIMLLPSLAVAQRCTTFETDPLSAADISGGAVTSTVFPIASVRQLDLGIDVTDANNGITKIELSFTVAHASDGTYRKVPDCTLGATSYSCVPLKIDWDPKTDGKNYEATLPVAYAWMKITATPTGHGAGDDITVAVRGCQ